jgi:NADH:ubiquinone oxidoreductase subunit D
MTLDYHECYQSKHVWVPLFAERDPFAREVVHNLERKEERQIIREKDRSSSRRQPQVEDDVKALPRHPQRRRKTPSEACHA